jgi:hypothetical protein
MLLNQRIIRDVDSGLPGAEQGSKGATVLCIMTYVSWV